MHDDVIAAIEAAIDYFDAIACDNEACDDCPENNLHLSALRAHADLLRRGGWRDIASAPMDGTRTMVWSSRFNGCPVIARWDDERYMKKPRPRFITTCRIHGARDLEDAAYWQPLPPAPPTKGNDDDL